MKVENSLNASQTIATRMWSWFFKNIKKKKVLNKIKRLLFITSMIFITFYNGIKNKI